MTKTNHMTQSNIAKVQFVQKLGHLHKRPNYNKNRLGFKSCKTLKQVSKVCATS